MWTRIVRPEDRIFKLKPDRPSRFPRTLGYEVKAGSNIGGNTLRRQFALLPHGYARLL
jgi:hypothetical protein